MCYIACLCHSNVFNNAIREATCLKSTRTHACNCTRVCTHPYMQPCAQQSGSVTANSALGQVAQLRHQSARASDAIQHTYVETPQKMCVRERIADELKGWLSGFVAWKLGFRTCSCCCKPSKKLGVLHELFICLICASKPRPALLI